MKTGTVKFLLHFIIILGCSIIAGVLLEWLTESKFVGAASFIVTLIVMAVVDIALNVHDEVEECD